MADVFTHFNYLHTIPEIGMKEFKTCLLYTSPSPRD